MDGWDGWMDVLIDFYVVSTIFQPCNGYEIGIIVLQNINMCVIEFFVLMDKIL